MALHHITMPRHRRTPICLRWRHSSTTAIIAAALIASILSPQRNHHHVLAAQTETLMAIVGKDFILIGADSSVSQSISLTASNLDKIAPLVEPFQYEDPRPRDPRQQQTVVAAVAGDAADADRLVGLLQALATIGEYETGVGSDVVYSHSSAGRTFGHRRRRGKNDASRNGNGDENDANDGHGRDDADALLPEDRFVPHSHGFSVESIAQLARTQIMSNLRTREPSNVCLLIAGMMPIHCSGPNQAPIAAQVQRQIQVAQSTNGNGNVKMSVDADADIDSSNDNGNENGNGVDGESANTLNKDKDRAKDSSSNSVNRLGLEPRLYWLDEYGALQQLQYGAHGYGSNFVLSILDQGYRPDMSKEECITLLRECFRQLRTRYIINSPQPPCIKCVDARGCVLIT